MATLTKAQLADRALQVLGILPAGDSSSTEDSNRAQESVDSIYYMLRKEGLAPFQVSAWPEWAQSAAAHLVALELAPTFGVTGQRLDAIATLASKGRQDLATQLFGKRNPAPIRTEYF